MGFSLRQVADSRKLCIHLELRASSFGVACLQIFRCLCEQSSYPAKSTFSPRGIRPYWPMIVITVVLEYSEASKREPPRMNERGGSVVWLRRESVSPVETLSRHKKS